jgi:hypothetical protein
MLDPGDPGDDDPHGGGDIPLREAELLAGLGELMPERAVARTWVIT